MDDYISREAALKKLQMQLLDLEADQDKGEYSELCENRGARDALDEAIYDIRTLKAADVQPINRWIKADESLPVYGGMVLICDKSKNIRLGIYTDMGWCSQFGNPMMCKITHWQSLPEPPKDGDTNG